jgi:AmmeMemoRadiSam system protein B
MELPARLLGGVVPHAGWVCSGRLAGMTFESLARCGGASTVILCGSVHTMTLERPALDSADAWQTPIGALEVDSSLRDAMASLPGFEMLNAAHVAEHSLEVQLPLMRHALGSAVRIVPCLVPPMCDAPDWGVALGQLLCGWDASVVVVASSDLTHYGANYQFAPEGTGSAGTQWAMENDRRLLDHLEAMDAQALVPEAQARRNACGGGALAMTVSAVQQMGARRGLVLEHTNSQLELAKAGHDAGSNSVGYAAMVFA